MKIALIAHDKKKDEIIELAKKYKDVLGAHELYATGTTGTLIMGETGLSIHRMKSGPMETTGTVRTWYLPKNRRNSLPTLFLIISHTTLGMLNVL